MKKLLIFLIIAFLLFAGCASTGDTGRRGAQGETGEKGDKGDILLLNGSMNQTPNMTSGYTPIFGIDYFNGSAGTTDYNQLLNLPDLGQFWTGTNYNASYLTETSNYNSSYWTGTNYNSSYALNSSIITDHGALTGLIDDDHVRYFDKDCSKALTSDNIMRNVNNSEVAISGGSTMDFGGALHLYGKDIGWLYDGGMLVTVVNAAKNTRLVIFGVTGNTDTPFLNMLSHLISNVKDPVSAQDAATKNYVDKKQKCGATATVADGGTITHGFGATPTYVLTTGTIANNVIDVTAKGSTTFTVSIKLGNTGAAGTTQTVYWCVG